MSNLIFSTETDQINETIEEKISNKTIDDLINDEKLLQKDFRSLSQDNDKDINTITDDILENELDNDAKALKEDFECLFQDYDNDNVVPVKRNTKTYEKDKINLMGETQRLLRDSESQPFKYKPKQFKTITDYRKEIAASLEIRHIQGGIIKGKNDSSDNLTVFVEDKVTEDSINYDNSTEPLPLLKRLNVDENVKLKLSTQPKTNSYTLQIENILKKKYNNGHGYVELKSKEDYERDKRNSQSILNSLKKSLNYLPVIDNNSYTDLTTIRKSVDPQTGCEILEKKIISVKKNQDLIFGKTPKGIDPHIAKQIQSRLSGEELLKWNLMSVNEKKVYHRKLLLKDSDAKRRELRLLRMKDMPVINKVEKIEKKKDNDGLSDDDSEWTGDKEENSDDDSNEESTNSESDKDVYEEDDDDEDMFNKKKKYGKHIRVGIIDDDDDEENDNVNNKVLQLKDTQSFVEDSEIINISENESLELSSTKDYIRVLSPSVGIRERRRCEMSPKIEINKDLLNIKLPDDVMCLIGNLKKKFGLVNKLVSGDSSVLLLPTMKTTTASIEVLLKNQLMTEGHLNTGIIREFEKMLNERDPQIIATWKDSFNLLSSIQKDNHNLASYSFMNASIASFKTVNKSVQFASINNDDTIVMEPSNELNTSDLRQEATLLTVDESSTSTVILNSDDNSINNGLSSSAHLNDYHAKIFKFDDSDKVQISKDSVTEVFQNLSSLMNACESSEQKDSKEKEDEDINLNDNDNVENVDLSDSDNGFDVDLDNSSNNVGDVDLDDSDDEDNQIDGIQRGMLSDDEEEQLRRHIKSGMNFIPTDYIDEEAALSGSDAEEYGPDEDERNLDEYEDEEGDNDKLPSIGKMRRQIETIHHKLDIDKDANDIRYLKEMYLKDGDLYGGDEGPRKKRFGWHDMNDDNMTLRAQTMSDEEYEEEYEDLATSNFITANEEPKQNIEEEGLLLEKYNKFIFRIRSIPQENKDVSRPAWSSDICPKIPAAVQPSVKRCGSMMNKTMHSFNTIKIPSISKTSLNDFDLKTRMSDMYNIPKRQADVSLKRGDSVVPEVSLKKQRMDDK